MRPRTVAEYIAAAPKPLRARLRSLRSLIRGAAPKAEESLKWGSPAYTQKRVLVMFAHFKQHISIFPTPAVIRSLRKELSKFHTTSATIHFPHDKPLPATLIRKIVRTRVAALRGTDAKWRTSTPRR